MGLYNDTCYITCEDETKVFQTALAIVARSNINIFKPASFNPDSIIDKLTTILESEELTEYALNEIGGETARKIEEDKIPTYAFWNLQAYAFNKLIEYELCEYHHVIFREDFESHLSNGKALIMSYKEDPQDSKEIPKIITVLGFDNNEVEYCNPVPGLDNDKDLLLKLDIESFWKHTDSGGDLHHGIVFNIDNNKYSKNYRLLDRVNNPFFTHSDLTTLINTNFNIAKDIKTKLSDVSNPLIMSGANGMIVGDGNVYAAEKFAGLRSAQLFNQYANTFLGTCLYRNHPTVPKKGDIV